LQTQNKPAAMLPLSFALCSGEKNKVTIRKVTCTLLISGTYLALWREIR